MRLPLVKGLEAIVATTQEQVKAKLTAEQLAFLQSISATPNSMAECCQSMHKMTGQPMKGMMMCPMMPTQIRVDYGPEFVSAKLLTWCDTHNVNLQFIQPGRPMQNGYVERFHGSFRTEILDAYTFGSLDEVRELAHEWMNCCKYGCSHDVIEETQHRPTVNVTQ